MRSGDWGESNVTAIKAFCFHNYEFVLSKRESIAYLKDFNLLAPQMSSRTRNGGTTFISYPFIPGWDGWVFNIIQRKHIRCS